jgi:hypothetical protein
MARSGNRFYRNRTWSGAYYRNKDTFCGKPKIPLCRQVAKEITIGPGFQPVLVPKRLFPVFVVVFLFVSLSPATASAPK